MTYKSRLIISKLIIGAAALLNLLPLWQGSADRAAWFWCISLPVLFYLLWGGLHGTGRSVRTVGYLGMAYGISHYFAGVPVDRLLNSGLIALFALGIIISIRRRSETTE